MASARYLRIYLNDHLAALTATIELVRRVRRQNAGGELADVLAATEAELIAGRGELLARMRRHGIEPSWPKVVGARAAERLGRLKPNGHLRTYSPLSRLLELEALGAALEFDCALWESLGEDERAQRMRGQRARLEPHRLAAASAIQ